MRQRQWQWQLSRFTDLLLLLSRKLGVFAMQSWNISEPTGAILMHQLVRRLLTGCQKDFG